MQEVSKIVCALGRYVDYQDVCGKEILDAAGQPPDIDDEWFNLERRYFRQTIFRCGRGLDMVTRQNEMLG